MQQRQSQSGRQQRSVSFSGKDDMLRFEPSEEEDDESDATAGWSPTLGAGLSFSDLRPELQKALSRRGLQSFETSPESSPGSSQGTPPQSSGVPTASWQSMESSVPSSSSYLSSPPQPSSIQPSSYRSSPLQPSSIVSSPAVPSPIQTSPLPASSAMPAFLQQPAKQHMESTYSSQSSQLYDVMEEPQPQPSTKKESSLEIDIRAKHRDTIAPQLVLELVLTSALGTKIMIFQSYKGDRRAFGKFVTAASHTGSAKREEGAAVLHLDEAPELCVAMQILAKQVSGGDIDGVTLTMVRSGDWESPLVEHDFDLMLDGTATLKQSGLPLGYIFCCRGNWYFGDIDLFHDPSTDSCSFAMNKAAQVERRSTWLCSAIAPRKSAMHSWSQKALGLVHASQEVKAEIEAAHEKASAEVAEATRREEVALQAARTVHHEAVELRSRFHAAAALEVHLEEELLQRSEEKEAVELELVQQERVNEVLKRDIEFESEETAQRVVRQERRKSEVLETRCVVQEDELHQELQKAQQRNETIQAEQDRRYSLALRNLHEAKEDFEHELQQECKSLRTLESSAQSHAELEQEVARQRRQQGILQSRCVSLEDRERALEHLVQGHTDSQEVFVQELAREHQRTEALRKKCATMDAIEEELQTERQRNAALRRRSVVQDAAEQELEVERQRTELLRKRCAAQQSLEEELDVERQRSQVLTSRCDRLEALEKELRLESATKDALENDHKKQSNKLREMQEELFEEKARLQEVSRAQESSAASPIIMRMTLKHIEYESLQEETKEELKANVRRALAKSGGVAERSVTVMLSPGSVRVVTKFLVPPVHPVSAEATADTVLKAAKSTDGVLEVATGEISISDPELLSDADAQELANQELERTAVERRRLTTNLDSTYQQLLEAQYVCEEQSEQNAELRKKLHTQQYQLRRKSEEIEETEKLSEEVQRADKARRRLTLDLSSAQEELHEVHESREQQLGQIAKLRKERVQQQDSTEQLSEEVQQAERAKRRLTLDLSQAQDELREVHESREQQLGQVAKLSKDLQEQHSTMHEELAQARRHVANAEELRSRDEKQFHDAFNPSTTLLQMHIENIDFNKLDSKTKDDLQLGLRRAIAKNTSVPEDAVSVTLQPGSVKVIATVNAPEGLEMTVDKSTLYRDVIQTANSIEGVGKAVVDELSITELKVLQIEDQDSLQELEAMSTELQINYESALENETSLYDEVCNLEEYMESSMEEEKHLQEASIEAGRFKEEADALSSTNKQLSRERAALLTEVNSGSLALLTAEQRREEDEQRMRIQLEERESQLRLEIIEFQTKTAQQGLETQAKHAELELMQNHEHSQVALKQRLQSDLDKRTLELAQVQSAQHEATKQLQEVHAELSEKNEKAALAEEAYSAESVKQQKVKDDLHYRAQKEAVEARRASMGELNARVEITWLRQEEQEAARNCQQTQAELEEKVAKIVELQASLSALEQENLTTHASEEGLQAELEEKVAKIVELQASLSTLKQEHLTTHASEKGLQAELEDKVASLSTLKQEHLTTHASEKGLQAELEEKAAKIVELQASQGTLKQEHLNTHASAKGLQAELQEKVVKIVDLQASLSALEQQHLTTQASEKGLQAELKEKVAKIVDLQASLSALKQEHLTANASKKGLQGKLEGIGDINMDLIAERQLLTEEYNSTREEYKSAQKELERLRAQQRHDAGIHADAYAQQRLQHSMDVIAEQHRLTEEYNSTREEYKSAEEELERIRGQQRHDMSMQVQRVEDQHRFAEDQDRLSAQHKSAREDLERVREEHKSAQKELENLRLQQRQGSVESITVVQMTIENVDFEKLDQKAKDELKLGLRGTIAKTSRVQENSVSVRLEPGSVKVIAKVKAPQGHLKTIDKGSLSRDVLQTAQSMDSVQKAAVGELNVTEPTIHEEEDNSPEYEALKIDYGNVLKHETRLSSDLLNLENHLEEMSSAYAVLQEWNAHSKVLGTQAGQATTVIEMSIEKLDFHKLDRKAKEDLQLGVRRTIATNISVPEDRVSVALEPGSVKVIARVNTPPGLAKRINTTTLTRDILQTTKAIDSVEKAVVGTLRVTEPTIHEEEFVDHQDFEVALRREEALRRYEENAVFKLRERLQSVEHQTQGVEAAIDDVINREAVVVEQLQRQNMAAEATAALVEGKISFLEQDAMSARHELENSMLRDIKEKEQGKLLQMQSGTEQSRELQQRLLEEETVAREFRRLFSTEEAQNLSLLGEAACVEELQWEMATLGGAVQALQIELRCAESVPHSSVSHYEVEAAVAVAELRAEKQICAAAHDEYTTVPALRAQLSAAEAIGDARKLELQEISEEVAELRAAMSYAREAMDEGSSREEAVKKAELETNKWKAEARALEVESKASVLTKSEVKEGAEKQQQPRPKLQAGCIVSLRSVTPPTRPGSGDELHTPQSSSRSSSAASFGQVGGPSKVRGNVMEAHEAQIEGVETLRRSVAELLEDREARLRSLLRACPDKCSPRAQEVRELFEKVKAQRMQLENWRGEEQHLRAYLNQLRSLHGGNHEPGFSGNLPMAAGSSACFSQVART